MSDRCASCGGELSQEPPQGWHMRDVRACFNRACPLGGLAVSGLMRAGLEAGDYSIERVRRMAANASARHQGTYQVEAFFAS